MSSSKPSLFTICIGNVTVGGNGKTPTVHYITDNLKEDYSPGILGRGYKSKPPSFPHIVSKKDSPHVAGDEALLLASMLPDNIPIVTSPNRAKGLEVLKSHLANICIMDDGLQHLGINPQVKLCLIDLAEGEEYLEATPCSVLPYGIFRENPFKGIKKADRVVFVSKKKLSLKETDLVLNISSIFSLKSYSILEIIPNAVREGFTWNITEHPEYRSYTLLSSIAKPESFQESVKSLQLKFDMHIIREDHHSFSEQEWLEIQKNSRNPILCTAKDWIKLRPYLKREDELLVLTQSVYDSSPENQKLLPWIREIIKNQ